MITLVSTEVKFLGPLGMQVNDPKAWRTQIKLVKELDKKLFDTKAENVTTSAKFKRPRAEQLL